MSAPFHGRVNPTPTRQLVDLKKRRNTNRTMASIIPYTRTWVTNTPVAEVAKLLILSAVKNSKQKYASSLINNKDPKKAPNTIAIPRHDPQVAAAYWADCGCCGSAGAAAGGGTCSISGRLTGAFFLLRALRADCFLEEAFDIDDG